MRVRKVCPYAWWGTPLFLLGLSAIRASVHATPLPQLATGADFDESRVQNVYHVDVASADAANDDKHGTVDAPFATISYGCQAAIRDKDRNIGAKVLIAPGVYRETVEIPAPGGVDTDAPLVIESAERGQAVIDGADTENWSASTWKSDGSQWSHPWPFRRSPVQLAVRARALRASGAPPSAAGGAYEPGDLILVDGDTMRQVNRQEDLAPGCFWCRAAPGGGRSSKPTPDAPETPDGPAVLLRPASGTRLADSIIQIGTRDHGLVIHGRRNLVVRGMVFQHAAGPAATENTAAGLWIDGCSNVLIDDVLSQWNDGTGLVITGRASASWSADFTVRQSHFLHNGSTGLRVTGIKNLLVEDTEACFNNYRGEWANWVDATGPAGVRTRSVHASTYRRLRAVGNFCRGLWWDGDNTDATLEDGELRGNLVSGLFIDHDSGPLLVRRSLVVGTKSHPSVHEETAWPAGVSVVATPDVTLESNVLAANAVTQLGLRAASARPEDTDFENRSAKRILGIERHLYRHNVFFGIDATQSMYTLAAPEGVDKAGPPTDFSTLESGENCFWNPLRPDVFPASGTPSKGPGNRPAVDFNAWRETILARGAEKVAAGGVEKTGSLWQDPLFADPAEGDYRLGENSPVARWNLPSDDGSAAP